MNTFFTKNMGNTERAVRIGLGTVMILATLLTLAQMAGWVAVLLIGTGVTLIVEGLLAWCPVRAFLGLGASEDSR